MPLVNFSNLDFDQVKISLQDYLKANSTFTDYDFEGSNLSSIIDVLAYNTYITSYNANMVTNEVFIDSATLREKVVSLARNIVFTLPGEKFFDQNFGSRISATLFENIDDITANIIVDEITNSIERYEPRVDLINVEAFPNFDNNAFDVLIVYDIIGADVPPQELQFALQSTR